MRFLILFLLLLWPSSSAAQTAVLPEPKRLAVVGDSLSRGLSATSEQKAFANIVASRLGYELARYGVGGVAQAEAVAGDVVSWNPDIVIIQVGINDTSRFTAREWGERYNLLVERFDGAGIRVITSTLFVAHQDDNHPRHKLLRGLSDEVLALDHDVADVWAATFDCGACISDMAVPSPFPPLYRGDGFHPGDHGHALIAHTFLDVILGEVYVPLYKFDKD